MSSFSMNTTIIKIEVYNRFKKRIDVTNYHVNLSIPETKETEGLCDFGSS